jgi:hypothetical protein
MATPITARRTTTRRIAAASSQWRTPVRRQESEELEALQSVVEAWAAGRNETRHAVSAAMYLCVATRFVKICGTFDLRWSGL